MTAAFPNYWAIVPAAGVGKRFSADIPKQFHQLKGDLVAQHTLSRLLKIPLIKRIVAPCDPTSGYWSKISAVKKWAHNIRKFWGRKKVFLRHSRFTD